MPDATHFLACQTPSILSEILQVDLFSGFSDARFSVRERPPKKPRKKRAFFTSEILGRDILKATCPDIARCFTVRHDTVHSTGTMHRPAARETRLIANSAWQFNAFVGMHLEGRFAELWGRR